MRVEPESIIKAKARAKKILSMAHTPFALYFPNAKLAGVSQVSHRFDIVFETYPWSILGVYEPSCPFQSIEADIETYYAEYASMLEARNAIDRAKKVEVPVFRSSGRRDKEA